MKQLMILAAMVALTASAMSDTLGTGANQFTIDFVTISGSTNPTSGYGIVNNDYRIGKYEITNDQWNKFKNNYGPVTGNPSSAYDANPHFAGTNVPTNLDVALRLVGAPALQHAEVQHHVELVGTVVDRRSCFEDFRGGARASVRKADDR